MYGLRFYDFCGESFSMGGIPKSPSGFKELIQWLEWIYNGPKNGDIPWEYHGGLVIFTNTTKYWDPVDGRNPVLVFLDGHKFPLECSFMGFPFLNWCRILSIHTMRISTNECFFYGLRLHSVLLRMYDHQWKFSYFVMRYIPLQLMSDINHEKNI